MMVEIKNLNLYREKLLEVLHDDTFSELMSFWREVEERECDYKIFVSKKCYNLYKVFMPLFQFPSYKNCIKITDTAIPIYLSDMRNKRVLIIDDVFIHGRTSLKIAEKIRQKNTKIEFFVFAKNNNLGTRQDVSFNNFKNLFEKFTKEFGRNERTLNVFYKSGLDIEAKNYWDKFVRGRLESQDSIVEGFVICDSEYHWKRISDLIMKSLWSVNMPYVSYLPTINMKDETIADEIFKRGRCLSSHRQERLKQAFSYYISAQSQENGGSKIYYCNVIAQNKTFKTCKIIPMVFLDCENTSIDKKFVYAALEVIYKEKTEELKEYFGISQNDGLVSLLKYLIFCIGYFSGKRFLEESNIQESQYEIDMDNATYSFGAGIGKYLNILCSADYGRTLDSIEQCKIKTYYMGERKRIINKEYRKMLFLALNQAFLSMANCKMEKNCEPIVDLLGKYFKDNNLCNEEKLYRVNDKDSIMGLRFSEIKIFLEKKGFSIEDIIVGLMYQYNLGAATIDFLKDYNYNGDTIGINMYWRAGEQSYKCISNTYVLLVYYQNLYMRRFVKEIADFLSDILLDAAKNNYKFYSIPFEVKDFKKYCGITDDVYDAFDIEEYCELEEFKYLGYIGKQLEQFILFGNVRDAKEKNIKKFKDHFCDFIRKRADKTLWENCKKILWNVKEISATNHE